MKDSVCSRPFSSPQTYRPSTNREPVPLFSQSLTPLAFRSAALHQPSFGSSLSRSRWAGMPSPLNQLRAPVSSAAVPGGPHLDGPFRVPPLPKRVSRSVSEVPVSATAGEVRFCRVFTYFLIQSVVRNWRHFYSFYSFSAFFQFIVGTYRGLFGFFNTSRFSLPSSRFQFLFFFLKRKIFLGFFPMYFSLHFQVRNFERDYLNRTLTSCESDTDNETFTKSLANKKNFKVCLLKGICIDFIFKTFDKVLLLFSLLNSLKS